jgi:DNA-binding MarR family transcriptional regulator
MAVSPSSHRHLPPTRAKAFLGLIRAGEELGRRLDAELERRHGLSLRAFEVLLFLAEFSPEGRKRMADLAAQAPLSQSRVSRLVADLEARGWVERSRAEDDGRGVSVAITGAGREKFRAAQATHLRDLDRFFFNRLTETEVGHLAAITTKLLERDG